MPYMDPQPPDISCTTSSTGLSSLTRRSQITDSASSRKSGFSGALAEASGPGSAAEEEGAGVWLAGEVWKLERIEERMDEVCVACSRGRKCDDVAAGRMAATGPWNLELTDSARFAACGLATAGPVALRRLEHLWHSISTALEKC